MKEDLFSATAFMLSHHKLLHTLTVAGAEHNGNSWTQTAPLTLCIGAEGLTFNWRPRTHLLPCLCWYFNSGRKTVQCIPMLYNRHVRLPGRMGQYAFLALSCPPARFYNYRFILSRCRHYILPKHLCPPARPHDLIMGSYTQDGGSKFLRNVRLNLPACRMLFTWTYKLKMEGVRASETLSSSFQTRSFHNHEILYLMMGAVCPIESLVPDYAKPYSRRIYKIQRIILITSQDKTFVRNKLTNLLYFVHSMITTCFGLHKRPSSGDYLCNTKYLEESYHFITTDPLSQQ
jgi:hypothetical protein